MAVQSFPLCKCSPVSMPPCVTHASPVSTVPLSVMHHAMTPCERLQEPSLQTSCLQQTDTTANAPGYWQARICCVPAESKVALSQDTSRACAVQQSPCAAPDRRSADTLKLWHHNTSDTATAGSCRTDRGAQPLPWGRLLPVPVLLPIRPGLSAHACVENVDVGEERAWYGGTRVPCAAQAAVCHCGNKPRLPASTAVLDCPCAFPLRDRKISASCTLLSRLPATLTILVLVRHLTAAEGVR